MTLEPPARWTLAASAFNWTPDVIRAERAAPDIAVGIVTDGIAPVIELEPGQLWRSFPESADDEVDALRATSTEPRRREHRRREPRRLARTHGTARRGRAPGLPAPPAARGAPRRRRRRAAPDRAGGRAAPAPPAAGLHELDLVLYEEIQGQQTPESPGTAAAIEVIAEARRPAGAPARRHQHAHARAAADLPRGSSAGPASREDLLTRLTDEWRDPATTGAVVEFLGRAACRPRSTRCT